jgi:hypothetical protein
VPASLLDGDTGQIEHMQNAALSHVIPSDEHIDSTEVSHSDMLKRLEILDVNLGYQMYTSCMSLLCQNTVHP